MPRSLLHRLTVALAAEIALAISGCAAPADISAPFAGIESLVPSGGGAEGPSRLFVIHGMTDHDIDFADELVASLTREMSLAQTGRRDVARPIEGAPLDFGTPASVNLRTYDLSKGGHVVLRVTSLTWSAVTRSIKRSRFAVDDAVKRASINGQIKRQVINDGMGDAVLYVGSYQPVMRRAVVVSLCEFLEGQYFNGKCNLANASNAPIAFISSSLGSIMLFDAIEDMFASDSAVPVRAALVRTRLFFMFANQLPLIDLGTVKPISTQPMPAGPRGGTDSRLRRFLQEVALPQPASIPGTAAPTALHVVAFTDPNDLLSFRLQESDVAFPGVALTNVSQPVATAWFGLFANPLVAHTGYEKDAAVLKLVTCGSAGCKR